MGASAQNDSESATSRTATRTVTKYVWLLTEQDNKYTREYMEGDPSKIQGMVYPADPALSKLIWGSNYGSYSTLSVQAENLAFPRQQKSIDIKAQHEVLEKPWCEMNDVSFGEYDIHYYRMQLASPNPNIESQQAYIGHFTTQICTHTPNQLREEICIYFQFATQ